MLSLVMVAYKKVLVVKLALCRTLKLDKLIAIYDRNQITIEGSTPDLAFTEDVVKRYESITGKFLMWRWQ